MVANIFSKEIELKEDMLYLYQNALRLLPLLPMAWLLENYVHEQQQFFVVVLLKVFQNHLCDNSRPALPWHLLPYLKIKLFRKKQALLIFF